MINLAPLVEYAAAVAVALVLIDIIRAVRLLADQQENTQ